MKNFTILQFFSFFFFPNHEKHLKEISLKALSGKNGLHDLQLMKTRSLCRHFRFKVFYEFCKDFAWNFCIFCFVFNWGGMTPRHDSRQGSLAKIFCFDFIRKLIISSKICQKISVIKQTLLFLTEETYSHGTTPDKEVWPSPFKCQLALIWTLILIQIVLEQTLRLVEIFVVWSYLSD